MRAALVAVAGVAVALYATSARADAVEIGVDVVSGRFTSLLPYMKDISLAFTVDENTTVTTTYWRLRDGEKCDSSVTPPRDRSTSLASLREGDPKDGQVKLVAHIGTLSVGFKYCFQFSAEARTPLTAGQRDELTEGMFRAIVQQAADAVAHARLDATPRSLATHGLVSELSAGESALLQAPVILHQQKYPTLLAELKDRIRGDSRLVDVVQKTYIRAANLARNRGLSHWVEGLDEVLQASPTSSLAYQPVEHWEQINTKLASVAKGSVKDELKAAKSESKVLEVLRAEKAAVKLIESKANLTDQEKSELQALLGASATPVPFEVPREDLLALRQALAESGKSFAQRRGALQEFKKKFSLPDSMVGWPHANDNPPPIAVKLVRVVLDLETSLDDFAAQETDFDATHVLGANDAWKTLVDEVQSDTVSSVTTTKRTVTGPPEDVFPAYIGLDIGVAGASLPDATRAFGSVEPLQYFGLNFYLAAVDKNDPVTSETPFVQRAGFTVGMHVLSPANLESRGVTGILADRMLLVGAGYRATTYIRASVGAVLFHYKNPSPLVVEERTEARPYAALSLDFDTFGVIAGKYK